MAAAMAEVGAIGPAVDTEGVKALHELVDKVEMQAKANAPFRTGDLMRSIHCEATSHGITCYSDLDYAYWQEFGFRHKWSGKWVPGKFFITKAITKYVETPDTDKKILDKIEHKARKTAIVAAAAATEMAALASIFGILSFIMMGFAALMGTRG